MSAFTTWKNRLERIEEKLAYAEDAVAEFEAISPRPLLGGKAIYYMRDSLVRKKTETLKKLEILASRGENWRFKLSEKQDRVATLEIQEKEQVLLLENTHNSIFSHTGDPDKNAIAYKTYTLLLINTRKQLAIANADLNKHKANKPLGIYETLPEELLQYAAKRTTTSMEVEITPPAMLTLEKTARMYMNHPETRSNPTLPVTDVSSFLTQKSDSRMPEIQFGASDEDDVFTPFDISTDTKEEETPNDPE